MEWQEIVDGRKETRKSGNRRWEERILKREWLTVK
jgi:hypothetical protein